MLSNIFTSIIRNRIFTFVLQNKYIETNLQKRFWEKVSGCIEHTKTLTYVINHARKKQRNLVITLSDLKNAFGEADHELITYVLKFHHVPGHIIQLIQSLYSDYRIYGLSYIYCHRRVFNTANYRRKRSITRSQFIAITFQFSN